MTLLSPPPTVLGLQADKAMSGFLCGCCDPNLGLPLPNKHSPTSPPGQPPLPISNGKKKPASSSHRRKCGSSSQTVYAIAKYPNSGNKVQCSEPWIPSAQLPWSLGQTLQRSSDCEQGQELLITLGTMNTGRRMSKSRGSGDQCSV